MVTGEHIRRAASLYGNNIAAICEDERRTHREIDERSSRLANALLARGLARGERVVVLLENSIRCIEVDFALSKAGLVRVSLNPRITAGELEYVIQDAEPAAIILGSNFMPLAAPVTARTGDIREVVCVAEPGKQTKGGLGTDYESLLNAAPCDTPRLDIADEELHSIAYTSGSTGKPKGVMLTHRAIVQVAYNVLLEFGPHAPDEKVLLLQPLSHGSAYFVLAYYMRGCAVVLMRQFNAQRAMDLARNLDIETVKLVPTMLQRILALPHVKQFTLPKLRQIVYGGSYITIEILRQAISVFGSRLAQHYGQTEAPSTITVLSRHEHTIENLESGLLTSAGRPWTTVEVRVVDEAGNVAAQGAVGEIVVRAPHMMCGYWKRSELYASVVRDGWLCTNDLGRMDARGYVYLLGRKDEMIISGGYNISPREVEDALCSHPAITEAAVFGRADSEWGETVVACVSVRDKSATKQELVEFTRTVLGYKRPKEILILDELPKNQNGKIDKAALKLALSNH